MWTAENTYQMIKQILYNCEADCTVLIRKPQVTSGGGGAPPLHPPPRCAPVYSVITCALSSFHSVYFFRALTKNYHLIGSKGGVERAASLFFLVRQAKAVRNGNDRACHSRALTDFPLTLRKNKRMLAWCESSGPRKQFKVWVYVLLGKCERLINVL